MHNTPPLFMQVERISKSIYIFICLSVCLSVCLSTTLSLSLSVCVCVCVCISYNIYIFFIHTYLHIYTHSYAPYDLGRIGTTAQPRNPCRARGGGGGCDVKVCEPGLAICT
jgi:hypothetical protein